MTRLPELKTAKVITALSRLGFHELRHKGGHAKQIKVTPEEFLNAIRRRK